MRDIYPYVVHLPVSIQFWIFVLEIALVSVLQTDRKAKAQRYEAGKISD